MLLPDRSIERELLDTTANGMFVAGVDEVGRGALAGPATVGIAVIDGETSDSFPAGLRDSKLLSARARENLVQPVRAWVRSYAVGHASAQEVNQFGIMGALRIAASRAVGQLSDFPIGAVLLDGSHDWWSSEGLFDPGASLPAVPVRMEVKGDARCAVVAAASVLAKVERDTMMVEVAQQFPEYGFEQNKGYSSPAHIAALTRLGPSSVHRTAWKLPGVAQATTNGSKHE